MSKNLTRKGLAFGALVALAGSVFAGTPAAADANGPITLLPTQGTTFNTIQQSGIILNSAIDASYGNTEVIAFIEDGTNDLAATTRKAYLRYLITNPAGAEISIDTPGTERFWVYNSLGNVNAASTDTDAADTTDGTDNGTSPLVTVASSADAYGSTSNVITTKATKIVVEAEGSLTSNNLAISATAIADNVTVTVQGFLDYIGESSSNANGNDNAAYVVAGATELGKINGLEQVSKAETVVLYAPSNVSATTKITEQLIADSHFEASVVYSNDVNPYFVAAKTGVKLFKNGSSTPVDLTSAASNGTAITDDVAITAITATAGAGANPNTTSDTALAKDVLTAGVVWSSGTSKWINNAFNGASTSSAAWGAGTYTAQAVYATAANTYVNIGNASVVSDLTAGTNADVDGIKVSALAGKDLKFDSGNLTVRAGAKAPVVTVQAQDTTSDGSASVLAANIEVRAVVTATKLNTGSSVTVSGAAGSLAKTDDVITAYGRTDSNGKVSFTFTNSVGKDTDKLTAVISVKDDASAWVDATTSVITWATATLNSFDAKAGRYVSGANPSVTFVAKDQFGEGIDSVTAGSLSIYASAYVSGIESKTTFNKTLSTVNGAATFTFANFATAGSPAVLKAKLFNGGVANASYVVDVNVYNTVATDKITVADTFTTDVTYKDYVTGDSADASVAAKISDAGIATTVDIVGTVLNVSNIGQPGVAVTVSLPGALLKADGVYATDKITTYANEYGSFTVGVATHTVNTTGAVATITADGKTATTKVKSYFPASQLSRDNLKFSWSVPALLVKDTTYVLKAKLTDKWGNPIQTAGDAASVNFLGTGSVQINGLGTTVAKDFDKNGEAIVFIRSVSKIAGPGAITATLSVQNKQYSLNPTSTAGDSSTAFDRFETLASTTTDVTSTAWDETQFNKELSATVQILDKAPTASISKGTKSTTVVVKNANGTTIKVVRGTKSKTVAADANTEKVTLKGGTGKVTVYVNGVKVASK